MTMPKRILKAHSAGEAAELTVSIIESLGDQKDLINIGIPGGRSIIPILQALQEKGELLRRMNFYLVDERINGEKNAVQLYDAFFENMAIGNIISRKQINFPDLADGSLEQDIAAYEQNLPVFDIVILGVGEDGHVASLFPHSGALDSTKMLEHITDSPKEPSERITITFKAIPEEATVILLFLGESKKDALKRFIDEDNYQDIPASFFKRYEFLYVITDQDVE